MIGLRRSAGFMKMLAEERGGEQLRENERGEDHPAAANLLDVPECEREREWDERECREQIMRIDAKAREREQEAKAGDASREKNCLVSK